MDMAYKKWILATDLDQKVLCCDSQPHFPSADNECANCAAKKCWAAHYNGCVAEAARAADSLRGMFGDRKQYQWTIVVQSVDDVLAFCQQMAWALSTHGTLRQNLARVGCRYLTLAELRGAMASRELRR
jgi:hypothetical protein